MEVPCYQSKLLCELNEQRKRDFFCDCSILVDGRVFKAHRNVLFAGSGYFRALLVHYLQDSGQRHSTASLDIVTAEAFSTILDFLYSGRLALNSDNVIEVMSAASYLQMTDVVSFCKGYIRSSLEICNREKEKEKERDNGKKQDGGEGLADSGTPASPPCGSSGAAASPTPVPDRGPSLISQPTISSGTPSRTTLPNTPGPARDSESECSSRGGFPSEAGVRQRDVDLMNPSSSSSSGMALQLVHPKIEYDPEEELEESPEAKGLGLYPGPPLHHPHHGRLLLPSSVPSNEHSAVGYGGYQHRQFVETMVRGGGPSPLRDRVDHGQLFVQGMGPGADGGRVDEGLGLGGSSIMEIQSDWFGEDAGDGMVVPVKLHKCLFCPYTAKQKGILKRHIRCHTGERPFPCQICGKRFTRQEHLRSHAHSVHRSTWPVVCKGCRRIFTGNLSPGLRRFGLCDSCTCTTTTCDDSAPSNPGSQPEVLDRGDGDTDWSSFMDDVDEVEVGRVEDIEAKQEIHRQLTGTDVVM